MTSKDHSNPIPKKRQVRAASETATKWQIYTAADPTVERIFPSLAKEIGLNESIVLMQIAFWIKTSNNIVNDTYWTYQSMTEMQEKAFPYWSVDTIRRIIHKLQKAGYILIDQHNKRKGDNTQWYALEPDKLSTLKSIIVQPIEAETSTPPLQDASMAYSQVASPPLQYRTTLPEITTENKEKKSSSQKRDAIFDAIAEVFKTDAGGYIGNIKAMMLGTAKRGEWKRCNFDPPVEDAAEILAFGVYMKQRMAEKNITEISACVTIQRWFYDFRDEAVRQAARKITQLNNPADLTKWASPDPFAFLKSEGA